MSYLSPFQYHLVKVFSFPAPKSNCKESIKKRRIPIPLARSNKVRVLVPLRLNVTRRMANLDLLEERLRKDAKVEMEWQTVDFAAENPEQQVWSAQNSDIIFSAHGMALSYGKLWWWAGEYSFLSRQTANWSVHLGVKSIQ